MKRIFFTFIILLFAAYLPAQNIGIGIGTPTRAKLEVWGANGTGTTTALFGGDRGISFHRNFAGIGFNLYVDNANIGRYMSNGRAMLWQFIHNDQTLVQGLSLNAYPSGTANGVLPAPTRIWNFTSNNRWQIQTTGAGGSGILDVGRGTGGDGTAMFLGSTYHSHFNYSTNEHTYIRGGKGASHVVLNDIPDGKVIFGNTGITLGLNTNNYVPPTTLEVRQSNGGIELSNSSYTDRPWELRVVSGATTTFNLYYQGILKNYFRPNDGSLQVSDERVKTNIEDLQPVMERIMQLNPVTYMMKDAIKGQRRNMGFLAQNVEALFPQIISHHMPGDNDLLGLNYSGFGVIAIKGIQEEQVQIARLETDLSDAEKRLLAIEQKLGNVNKSKMNPKK
jgi:hypothetical protein